MGTGAVLVAAIGALASAHGGDLAQQPRCLKVLVPLAADTVPVSGDFESADCGGGRIAAAFRYDRANGTTRLSRAVAPGQIVPVYPEFGIGMVQPGQMLQLIVKSGPARIERQVEAMQPARSGQRLFVRSSDGQILSVRYEGGAP